MKFEFKNGLVWLPIQIKYSGKLIEISNCILDTGSASTAIDIDCIDFDYQKPAKIRRLFGIGNGTQEVVSQTVESLRLDNTIIKGVAIEFGNFKSKIGIDGFIGNDILSNFKLSIDYINKTIIIEE